MQRSKISKPRGGERGPADWSHLRLGLSARQATLALQGALVSLAIAPYTRSSHPHHHWAMYRATACQGHPPPPPKPPSEEHEPGQKNRLNSRLGQGPTVGSSWVGQRLEV